MVIDRRVFLAGAGLGVLLPGEMARAAQASWRIPVTLTTSRVLVDCTIAGQGPFAFVFDTGGAIGLLDMKLVKALKLRSLGPSTLGLKSGRKPYPIYEARDLAFAGQLRQPSAAFAGIENFNFGANAVGSLAAGVLSSVDGELDFEAQEWRIYRDTPPDRTGWTRYDKALVLRGNQNGSPFIFADATLGGKTFRFGLDTGMPGGMRIYRKTAEAAGLWNAPRWSPAAPGGKGRIVRVPALGLAGTTLEGVLVLILETPEWDYFDAGIIGLPILRRFNMATGAADGALYLKRNGLPAQPDADRYNRAGLWVDRDGQGAKIVVVGAGSPAESAGLKPGDRLTGIAFDTLIDRMFDPAGTSLALTVESGGTRRDLTLTLADFL